MKILDSLVWKNVFDAVADPLVYAADPLNVVDPTTSWIVSYREFVAPAWLAAPSAAKRALTILANIAVTG